MVSQIRRDKKLLFGLVGFGSGALGALIAEIVPLGTANNVFILIIEVALWAALCATIISIGLRWAIDFYNHRQTDWSVLLWKAIPSGLIAGAISGGIAQTIFGLLQFPETIVQLSFQAGCWGIMGCLLGMSSSYYIRNLGSKKATIAGAVGGIIGGFGFLLVSSILVNTFGRIVGIGIIGAALGLCLIIVEEHYRSAYLEVHWSRNETSKFTLGSIPTYIGGGKDDDVFVNGIPHHAMSLWLENGKVKGTYHVTGENKELHDGNPIKFGKVEMLVKMKSR
jgi:hypothetical protein